MFCAFCQHEIREDVSRVLLDGKRYHETCFMEMLGEMEVSIASMRRRALRFNCAANEPGFAPSYIALGVVRQ